MAEEIVTILQNILVFDIETVPDVAGGRRVHDIALGDDAGVAELLQHQRRIETQGATEFLRPYLHRVVAISALWWQGEQVKLNSFGKADDDEATLVAAFFQFIQRHAPQLVSWNGAAFDLPVLHYRALLHGEAIGWGMLAATELSRMRGLLTGAQANRISSVLHAYGPLPRFRATAEKLFTATARDKKNRAGARRFVLAESVGKAVIVPDVTDAELRTVIEWLLARIREAGK